MQGDNSEATGAVVAYILLSPLLEKEPASSNSRGHELLHHLVLLEKELRRPLLFAKSTSVLPLCRNFSVELIDQSYTQLLLNSYVGLDFRWVWCH